MGNGNSSKRPSGVWEQARHGDPVALRAGIERIPADLKAVYINLGHKTDREYRSPVAIATVFGHEECVQILLDAGADANYADRYRMTPLHLAVKANNTAIMEILLKSDLVDCNKPDIQGHTPLLAAAAAGQVQALNMLLHCDQVDLGIIEPKFGHSLMGVARKAYSCACDVNSSDMPRFKECLKLVEESIPQPAEVTSQLIRSNQAATEMFLERAHQRRELIIDTPSQSEQRYQLQLEQAIQISLMETRSSVVSPASRAISLLDEEALSSHSRPSSSGPSPTTSASPNTPAKARSDKSDCIICFDAAQSVACLPCGHMAMCMDCAFHVKNSTRVCPVCRSCVRDIVRIYQV